MQGGGKELNRNLELNAVWRLRAGEAIELVILMQYSPGEQLEDKSLFDQTKSLVNRLIRSVVPRADAVDEIPL